MPITLDDAVERAKLMADDNGLISQYSYNQLYAMLHETDRYPFTMALVDNGIITKTSKFLVNRVRKVIGKFDPAIEILEEITDISYVDSKVSEAARRFMTAQYDVDESGQVSYGGQVPETTQEQDINQEEVNSLRSVLEGAGVHVAEDGSVSFYKSSVPGVYTNKLPQSMPLSTAVGYYAQIANTATNEAARSGNLLDKLAQLSLVADSVGEIINELKSYKFSPKSQSDLVRGIAEGISAVSGFYESDRQTDIQESLNRLKAQVEQYQFEQGAKADSYKAVSDALTQLQTAKDSDPQLYSAVVKGLGGI